MMLLSTSTTWSLLLLGVLVFSFASTSPIDRNLIEEEDSLNEIDVDEGDEDLIHADKVDNGIDSDIIDEEIDEEIVNEEIDEEIGNEEIDKDDADLDISDDIPHILSKESLGSLDEDDNTKDDAVDNEEGSDEKTINEETEEDRIQAARDFVEEEIRNLVKELEEGSDEDEQEAEVVGDHEIAEEAGDSLASSTIIYYDEASDNNYINEIEDEENFHKEDDKPSHALSKWYLKMKSYFASLG